ncbi:hypothetical protein [Actinoplanes utahensis]|uniref:Uncharacterized protein n=1 Tax=Actinoplanes utahensis TaxID=1869 RepID=A0A0A6U9Y9_ACTUT|nr:hypothetical protein [Actinoplanes utahensis]KHD72241.1 hypothetical protein MB27_41440 [Actinoplanes utahensis]
MWVWIAVVVLAVVVLAAAGTRVVGRLQGLQRAARKLQHRQEEALALQVKAERMQQTMLELQQRAEAAQGQVAQIKAGLGRR